MPQEHEQEVLIRTLAHDSQSLAHNEPLTPEHVVVHPERAGHQEPSSSLEKTPAPKSTRTVFLLLFVFLLLGGMLTYLLLTRE